MFSRTWLHRFATLLVATTGMTCLAFGQEDPKPESQPEKKVERREVRVITVPNPSKHWIGIVTTPISDEALLGHLGIQDRLIVAHVAPGSPAANADVKKLDILLKFGDKEVHSVEDLIKAVDENANKDSTLTVLRRGKETALTIRPAERPADDLVARHAEIDPNLRVYVKEQDADGGDMGRYVLRMLGPGIAGQQSLMLRQPAKFPDGLSISVSKQDGQPAKIVAKKDGKTYEATEDKLDELPQEIREVAGRLFQPAGPIVAWVDPSKFESPEKVREEVNKAIESAKKQAAAANAEHDAVRRRMEIRQFDHSAVESLKKELEILRQDVQRLKEQRKDESTEKGAEKGTEKP